MNEDDVLTTVRESFDGVRMTTTLETIEARGRARRRRRRLPACAGGAVATAAASAAVAATVLAAPASPAPAVSLAAWSVARGPGEGVVVTVRELHDTSGLQRRLQADGVPAVVWGVPREPRSCSRHQVDDLRLLQRVVNGAGTPASNVIRINPAAIPGRVRLSIGVKFVHVVMHRAVTPAAATGVTARPAAGQPATHQTGFVLLLLGLCR